MKIDKVHCFFEQSGTFKNVFKKNNISAFDYDLLNDYGETDYIIDLFVEIENAYNNEKSIFDKITSEDLIFAFFPCIFFCTDNHLFFYGLSRNYNNNTQIEINEKILERNKKRAYYYELLLKLFSVCELRQYRLIVENPYSTQHYLYDNFPYKPKIIDKNRNLKGDNFVKPTQYFFLNCEPSRKYQSFATVEKKIIRHQGGHIGNYCDKERSEINPIYAENFVNDYILSQKSKYTDINLFNYQEF